MVIGYPQPSKKKSLLIVQAFLDGCGGRLAKGYELESGEAVFFGCVGIEHVLNHARVRGPWIYSDNAYFDRYRGTHYRFTRNAFQPSALCPPDWKRWRALRLGVTPWHRNGRHIVLVEQSEHFLRISGGGTDWADRTAAELRRHTDRPIRLRAWKRDKSGLAATLQHDLVGAWALVTHMSAAATEAVLAGVPAFVTGPCAALPMACGDLAEIEQPRYPDNREAWAAGLAGRQFTLEELRSGMAWERLNA